MGASDRPRDDRHLSEDELNRYLDGDLDSAERARADAHLSHCVDCRSSLADVQMLASLLRDLPQVDVPRSFQLGPEFARPASLWDRLAALLLPMLPAMRATTVALRADAGRHHRVPDCRRSAVIRTGLGARGPCCDDQRGRRRPICRDEHPGHHRDSDCQYCPKGATSDRFGIAKFRQQCRCR